MGGEEGDFVDLPKNEPCHHHPFRKISKESTASEVSSKFISAASKIAFRFNKAAIRIKRNWKQGNVDREDDEMTLTECPRKPSVRVPRELCVQLSSIDYRPLVLIAQSHSAPSIMCRPQIPSASLLDLEDTDFQRIAYFLDAASVFQFSQTSSRIRHWLFAETASLKKPVATRYEIVIAFNNEKQRVDVRALKRNRSIRDQVFTGDSLEAVVPRFLHCIVKVTFGNGVNVYEWKRILIEMHKNRRLTPIALIFSGGALSKGNTCSGADLRSFSESEFVNFVGHFYPHVQEVQLLTTRLFRMSSSARLLSFISMISSFGISYDRPAVKYFFDDVKKIVSFWRHDPLSRSCTVYMRSPTGSSMLKWMDIGGTVAGNSLMAHRVLIPHTFQSGVSLIFHLH